MWAKATTLFSTVKDGIASLAVQHFKEYGDEVKRMEAIKRERKRQEELKKRGSHNAFEQPQPAMLT